MKKTMHTTPNHPRKLKYIDEKGIDYLLIFWVVFIFVCAMALQLFVIRWTTGNNEVAIVYGVISLLGVILLFGSYRFWGHLPF